MSEISMGRGSGQQTFVLECTGQGILLSVLHDSEGLLGNPVVGTPVSGLFQGRNETAVSQFLAEAVEGAVSVQNGFSLETATGRKGIRLTGFYLENRLLITGSLTQPETAMLEKQVQQSKESLELFAYTVSHDLREPVRMVKSFMELLLKKYGETLDEKAKSYVGYATDGAGRLDIMIQDLLQYYRCTRDMDIRQVDLADVIAKVQSKPDMQLQGIDVRVEYTGLPTLLANQEGLQIVVTHIFRLLLLQLPAAAEPVITISATYAEAYWQLLFTGNGSTAEPGQLRDIFNLFYNRAQQGVSGSALNGMAVAKRIIEHLGGSITAEQAAGGSMAIKIILPGTGIKREERS